MADPAIQSIVQALVEILITVPSLREPTGREDLVADLDPAFLADVPRAATMRADLVNIATAAWTARGPHGECGLVLLIEHATDEVRSTATEPRLTDLRDQVLRQLAKGSPVPDPPPGDTLACQPDLPPLGPVVPSGDDRGYVTAVRGVYHVYRQQGSFISSKVIPLAEYQPGEVIHRRIPQGDEASLRLWTLCEASQTLLDYRRLLVLGRPGIGKTSLIRFLVWQYSGLDGMILPVIVSLRAWRDPPERPRDLLQFIKDFLAEPSDPQAYPSGKRLVDHLDAYLADPDQQRRLIFLLDDYNRLPQDDLCAYQRQVGAIRAFAEQYDQAAIVVVSRSLDYDGALDGCTPPFELTEINPWGRDQVHAYIQRWMPDLLTYADRQPIRDLADIPLQLVELVQVVRQKRQEGVTPADLLNDLRNIQALLNAFVDQLFDFGEQAGHLTPATRNLVRDALILLAAGLAGDHKQGRYVDYPAVARYLGVSAPATFAGLLRLAAETTILDVIPDPRQVGFEQQQLEEYFAGLPPVSPAELAAGLQSDDPDTILRTFTVLDQKGVLIADGA